MGRVWQCVTAGVVGLTMMMAPAPADPAKADNVAIADDSYGYVPEQTTYDTDRDVVVTVAVDADFGPFWVAVQCGSDAVWFTNKITGRWKARQTLPDDMKTFHDVVCGLRKSLPYMAFPQDG